jgi:microcystin-dependent protein
MPRNGSGIYTLPQAAFSPNTTISSAAINSDFSDIATSLTGSIAADGQTPITGQFKFSAGAFSVPSITFQADTTSGFYLSSTGVVGLALDGESSVLFTGGTLTVSAPSSSAGGGITGTSGAILCPIGIINDFGGSTAPTGWFLCYGQAVSRTTYVELFTVIGTTYGIGDGSTTYNLPDCRGRSGVGKDDMGGTPAGLITTGATGGEQTHTLITTELAAHSHGVTDIGHTHSTNGFTGSGASGTYVGGGGGNFGVTGSAGNGMTTNTTGITINNAGGGGAHNNVQPTIIFNKIIFAGHP